MKCSELYVSHYEFIRPDKNRSGGRIGFYTKSSNSYLVRLDLNFINPENLTIEIFKPNSKQFLVATSNRPPHILHLIYSQVMSQLLGK